MEQPLCVICGAPATQLYAGNTTLPLCPLHSCETALEAEINDLSQEATAEAVEGEVCPE